MTVIVHFFYSVKKKKKKNRPYEKENVCLFFQTCQADNQIVNPLMKI